MTSVNPVNQVLLHVENALAEEITTPSGLKLYYDSSYRKEWNVAVNATIAALPSVNNLKHKEILSNLKVGDEVCVSYRIVADFSFQGDGGQFMQATEDNDYVKEYYNGKGESIKMYALPKRSGLIGFIWVAMYLDKNRNLIDGTQGTEEEVYRWMGQFSFGKTDIYTFNNYFQFDGQDYWRCNVEDIFAKKVKGHLVAVGNRVICKPIEESVANEDLISQHRGRDVKLRYTDRAKVLTGGKEKGIKKDDVISFNPNILERYEFWGKQYYLVNQDMVLGKWN